MVEPIFKKGDYIINRTSGDMAIIDSVTSKIIIISKPIMAQCSMSLKT